MYEPETTKKNSNTIMVVIQKYPQHPTAGVKTLWTQCLTVVLQYEEVSYRHFFGT